MRRGQEKGWAGKVKQWLFEYVSILDSSQVRSPYLLAAMTFLELTATQSYYYSLHYPFLLEYPLINTFLTQFARYFVHTLPFANPAFSLLLLAIYPLLMATVLLVQRVGPLKLLTLLITLATYFYPLLLLKLVLETLFLVQ
jgi:hypothetical protein